MAIGLGIGPAFKKGFSWSSYWTPQYQALLDAMTTEPSNNDKLYQARWVKKMVDGGYFAKAVVLDMFSVDAYANALINWKSPGTFNPTKNGSGALEFHPYAGCRGYGTSASINLNFNPTSDGGDITKDNICYMTAEGDDRYNSADIFGGYSAINRRLSYRSKYDNGNLYSRNNSDTANALANADVIKYYSFTRNNAANYDIYRNKTKTTVNANSVGLPDVDLYACGSNENGSLMYNNVQLRFVFIFTYLTEAEIFDIIDITEEYLAEYHSNIIGYDEYIASADKSTKTAIALDTYDGSGETLHPSVVNVGSVWNGYQYWMANTPLPFPNSIQFENPSIWASEDGVTWVIPDGLTNPIVAQPVGGYNADSEIFHDTNSNKLYIIYKQYAPATGNRIMICESSDGVIWSSPKAVLTPITGETEQVSPAMIKIGSKYYIYYHTYTTTKGTNPRLIRVSCDTVDGMYGDREEVRVTSAESEGSFWWHFDILFYDGYYWLTAAAFNSLEQSTRRIYIMKSSDGLTFNKSNVATIFVADELFERGGGYRPTLAIIGGQPTVYYGALSNTNKWGLVKVDVTLI